MNFVGPMYPFVPNVPQISQEQQLQSRPDLQPRYVQVYHPIVVGYRNPWSQYPFYRFPFRR